MEASYRALAERIASVEAKLARAEARESRNNLSTQQALGMLLNV